MWKLAISLTPSISKLAEDFVVSAHFAPAVLRVIDPDQFGAIPKSSTTQALVSMVHKWLQATDGTGAAVRVVLFHYRKAFDLIDHNLLVNKILDLSITSGVAHWVIDFITNRMQRLNFRRTVTQSGVQSHRAFLRAPNLARGCSY